MSEQIPVKNVTPAPAKDNILYSSFAEKLGKLPAGERLRAAEDAVALHKLINDWAPLKSVA